MDIKNLLSELVEIEYIAIRVELYIRPTDDVRSKLSSGLILDKNLIYAYKEKIKGLVKYQNNLVYISEYIASDYVEKMNQFIQNNINYINAIIYGLESGLDKDKIASYIKADQEMYVKLIHNNNIIMNNLADKYLKEEHEQEEVLETNQLINESNNNKECIELDSQEVKTVYQPHENISNNDLKQRYLFQISEIEKAIAEVEGRNEKSRKDINELYQYHNEIIKIKSALSQL